MPTPERFVEGYRDGHRDAERGEPRRLCVTRSGSEPAIVKRECPLYYHAYKRALTDADSGHDDMSGAWRAYESKHQSRDTLTSNARGIYREWNVHSGDYVLRRHRDRVYVDRIGAGGTHTTIGSAKGFDDVDRAIEGLKRDAHIQGTRGEPGVFNAEGTQLGMLGEEGQFEEWVSALDEMVSNKGWKVTADFGVHEQNAPRRDAEKETAVQTWIGTHVDDHYDAVGEPDYTGLAESAAYANGVPEWLVEGHPIWEWSTMAFEIAEED